MNISDLSLTIKNGMTFEDLIVQIQPFTKALLCVKNGEELIIFTDASKIPKTLSQEGKCVNNIYYYRCSHTDDLYAFFRRYTEDRFLVMDGKVSPILNHIQYKN